MSENLDTLRYDKRYLLYIFSGDQQQNESNSLIDYFKGQFSILNDVSIDIRLDITAKTQSFSSSLHLPNRLAAPKKASDMTSESKHSYHSCLWKASLVFRALIVMQFYRA